MTQQRRRVGVYLALLALLFNSLVASMHVHASWYGEPDRGAAAFLDAVLDGGQPTQDGHSGHAPNSDHCVLCQLLAQGVLCLPPTLLVIAAVLVAAALLRAASHRVGFVSHSSHHWSSRAPPAA